MADIENDMQGGSAESSARWKQAMTAAAEQSAVDTINAMGEGVALLAPNGEIKSVNPAFASFTERSQSDLEGEDIQKVLPDIFEEDLGEIVNTMTRISLKQSKQDPQDALCINNSHSSPKWVIPSLTTIHATENERVSLVLTVRDVTPLMEAQKRLRRLAHLLAEAEEQTKRELATHLHETVIQSLSLANIRMGALRSEVDSADPATLKGDIDNIRQQLDESISECRSIMADLTPPLLYEMGLVTALEGFVEKERELHGAPIKLETDNFNRTIEESTRGMLFHAIHEMVMNALKHAGPCQITIRIMDRDGDLRIEVEDNGKGFDPHQTDIFEFDEEGGFGLFNIRERLKAMGGSFSIDSEPGKGTLARIEMPL